MEGEAAGSCGLSMLSRGAAIARRYWRFAAPLDLNSPLPRRASSALNPSGPVNWERK